MRTPFLRTFSENFNYEGWLFAKICYQKWEKRCFGSMFYG